MRRRAPRVPGSTPLTRESGMAVIAAEPSRESGEPVEMSIGPARGDALAVLADRRATGDERQMTKQVKTARMPEKVDACVRPGLCQCADRRRGEHRVADTRDVNNEDASRRLERRLRCLRHPPLRSP